MNKLKELRNKAGYTQVTMANLLGISQPAYANYERGLRQPDYNTLSKLAEIFCVTTDYLLGRETSKPEPIDKFSSEEITYMEVVGSVKAGYDGMACEEHTGESAPIPTVFLRGGGKSDYFLLRVSGNSMYPKMIDGDLVLVKRTSSVDSGTVAVVSYGNDEATIKTVRYINGQDWIDLIPTNPEYETKHIKGADLENCRILGQVIKLIRDL